MKIKTVIIVIFKIILILFLVVTLNRIMMPKYINENKDGRITQEYYPASKYSDVIFVGSSTVFSGIDPLVLWEEQGISSYIRANASQTMWISYYMAEDAIRCHKPELVCIDTTFVKYDDDFIEEPSTRKSIDGMRLSRSKIDCALASMGEDEKLMDYIIPLFRFHSRWKEFTWDDIRYAWYNKPVTLNGYIEDDDVEPADSDVLKYTGEFTSISPKNELYLKKTIELCRENGIQVMLFKMPSFSPNWSDELDISLDRIAKEYGISYTNYDKYNDEIGLDYKLDTPDAGSHLNSAGAATFSRYFAKKISDNFDVTDRRDDGKYVRYWSRKIK